MTIDLQKLTQSEQIQFICGNPCESSGYSRKVYNAPIVEVSQWIQDTFGRQKKTPNFISLICLLEFCLLL
jgi:hypothetical protein